MKKALEKERQVCHTQNDTEGLRKNIASFLQTSDDYQIDANGRILRKQPDYRTTRESQSRER